MDKKKLNQTRKLNPKKVGAFAALIALLIILIIVKSSKTPKITLKDNSSIDIELGSTYSEPGATAKYGKKDISKSMKITDNIDLNKVGKYYVTYTVDYKKKTTSVTRTINVVDKVSPELTLNGKNEINIEQDSTYKELGCYAIDNYDGDISQKITIDQNIDTSVLGAYQVYYTVKDSSGNQATTERTVNVVKKGSGDISTEKNVGLPVLMYHFFYDKDSDNSSKGENYMEIHDFEDQLKYLTENNYYFPTWDEVKNYVDGKSCLPEHSIAITVDDGDESFFELAVPIIEKYDVKVTSFIVTSWIEDKSILTKYASSKIIFESHSNDMHKSGSNGNGAFLTLSHDEALADVKASKDFIGNATVFSYPYGQYSDSCESILKEAGYDLAFTKNYSRARPGDDSYSLGRIKIEKGISIDTFVQRVS